MADRTTIEWTDATWNVIGGCTRVDEGCRNCYAEIMAARFSGPGQWGEGLAQIVGQPGKTDHRWTGKLRFNESALDKPLRWRKPRRIFVNSTSDLFHQWVPDKWIDRVFAVMALCPQHTFQILTKRPERAREYLAGLGAAGPLDIFVRGGGRLLKAAEYSTRNSARVEFQPVQRWPLRNVWLGTSISDQASADLRIPHLLNTPAAVRFVSAEPLLGPLILDDMCDGWKFYDALRGNWWHDSEPPRIEHGKPRLDLVIVGGESGPGARPMHPDWARSLRDQCEAAGVAFFFKQWGEWESSLDRDRDDPDWRANYSTNYVDRGKSKWLNLAGGSGFHGERFHVMRKVSKSRAGRLLDGRTWDQMPGVAG